MILFLQNSFGDFGYIEWNLTSYWLNFTFGRSIKSNRQFEIGVFASCVLELARWTFTGFASACQAPPIVLTM